MIQNILIAATVLACAGGIAAAIRAIQQARQMAALLALAQIRCSVEDCGVALRSLARAERIRETIALLIEATRPAPISPIHFDTWMAERTERAHAEHMARIHSLPPCDTSIEGVARYMGAPI